jgi:hypothetical protein
MNWQTYAKEKACSRLFASKGQQLLRIFEQFVVLSFISSIIRRLEPLEPLFIPFWRSV